MATEGPPPHPPRPNLFSSNPLLEFKFRLFVANAIVGVAAIILMTPGVVYQVWYSEEQAEESPGRALREETERMMLSSSGETLRAESSAVSMPVLMWWTPFSMTKGRRVCPGGAECLFVTEAEKYWRHPMAKAVLFYGTDFDIHQALPLPRHSGQSWALLHEESPKNSMLFNHAPLLGMFNYTSTFRRASDLPLTLQYLNDPESISGTEFLVNVSEKSRLRREGNLSAVAYIQSNCDNPSGREGFVAELMKHVSVDSYGGCLKNKEFPEGLGNLESPQLKDTDEMKRFLARYKFVVAVENAVCPDYVTEKLWRALEVGAVPIYHGAPNVREFLPHGSKSAILIEDYASVEAVAEHIKELDGDDEAYAEYLSHKTGGISSETVRRMSEERSWGVSESGQRERGSFVDHLECLVCRREVERLRNRFRPVPYVARLDHYGCPAPRPMLGGSDVTGWIVEHVVAKVEGEALARIKGEEYSRQRLAEEAKWCLDNGDSCWKRGLDEETIRAVSKFNLTDLVMRRFGNS